MSPKDSFKKVLEDSSTFSGLSWHSRPEGSCNWLGGTHAVEGWWCLGGKGVLAVHKGVQVRCCPRCCASSERTNASAAQLATCLGHRSNDWSPGLCDDNHDHVRLHLAHCHLRMRRLSCQHLSQIGKEGGEKIDIVCPPRSPSPRTGGGMTNVGCCWMIIVTLSSYCVCSSSLGCSSCVLARCCPSLSRAGRREGGKQSQASCRLFLSLFLELSLFLFHASVAGPVTVRRSPQHVAGGHSLFASAAPPPRYDTVWWQWSLPVLSGCAHASHESHVWWLLCENQYTLRQAWRSEEGDIVPSLLPGLPAYSSQLGATWSWEGSCVGTLGSKPKVCWVMHCAWRALMIDSSKSKAALRLLLMLGTSNGSVTALAFLALCWKEQGRRCRLLTSRQGHQSCSAALHVVADYTSAPSKRLCQCTARDISLYLYVCCEAEIESQS